MVHCEVRWKEEEVWGTVSVKTRHVKQCFTMFRMESLKSEHLKTHCLLRNWDILPIWFLARILQTVCQRRYLQTSISMSGRGWRHLGFHNSVFNRYIALYNLQYLHVWFRLRCGLCCWFNLRGSFSLLFLFFWLIYFCWSVMWSCFL